MAYETMQSVKFISFSEEHTASIFKVKQFRKKPFPLTAQVKHQSKTLSQTFPAGLQLLPLMSTNNGLLEPAIELPSVRDITTPCSNRQGYSVVSLLCDTACSCATKFHTCLLAPNFTKTMSFNGHTG
jgi:hypothetical protein